MAWDGFSVDYSAWLYATVSPSDSSHLISARAAALTAFESALAGNPDDPDALLYAGVMSLRLGYQARALQWFAKLVALLEGSNDKLKVARAYRLQGIARASLPQRDLSGADSSFVIALGTYPDDTNPLELAEAYEQRGDALREWGKSSRALESYNSALLAYQRTADAAVSIQRVTEKLAALHSTPSAGEDEAGEPVASQSSIIVPSLKNANLAVAPAATGQANRPASAVADCPVLARA